MRLTILLTYSIVFLLSTTIADMEMKALQALVFHRHISG